MKMSGSTPQKRKTQSEMHLARGRLRGALNDTLQAEADDTDSQGTSGTVEDLPHRGRPAKNLQLQSPRALRHSSRSGSASPGKLTTTPKMRRRELQVATAVAIAAQQTQKIQAESFVMKLFDRSLDLSKYTEQTSLYPICRAWMANQPRNVNIRSYRELRTPSPVRREHNGRELLAKLRRKEMREMHAMPAPEETELSKIPTSLSTERKEIIHKQDVQFDNVAENEDDHINEQEQNSREELLAKHMRKWKQTKMNWLQHTKRYQQRYEINQLVIQELFKP